MSRTTASEHLSGELHELRLQNDEHGRGDEQFPPPNIEAILLLGISVLISILSELENR